MDTETDLDFNAGENPHEMRDKFAKLVIGTAVGFLAQRIADNLYDSLVTRIRANRL